MTCGPTAGGRDLTGVDPTKEAVIQGVVRRGGAAVSGAYVRLLDAADEFTAELSTGETGQFRFFAAPGQWTVRVLVPGARAVDRPVATELGSVAELEITVG